MRTDLALVGSRRMAVTGVGDWVGAELCRAARAAGWTVLAYGNERDPGPADLGGAYYRDWDWRVGPLEVKPVVDVVVHADADVQEWGPKRQAWRVNVDGTRHVMETFPDARFVHVSSASVYDPSTPSVLLTERAELPRRYLNAFAATKAEAERLLDGRADTVVLRPHGVYGRGDTTLLPRFAEGVVGGWFPLPGGGKVLHSMTSIDNLCAAVLLAAEPGPSGTFNIADARPVRVADAIEGILAAGGVDATVVEIPKGLVWGVAGLLERFWGTFGLDGEPPLTRYGLSQIAMERTFDISLARRVLGYAPTETDFGAAAGPRPVLAAL